MNTGLKFLDSLVTAVNAVDLSTVDPDFMPGSDMPEGAVVLGEMPEFACKMYVYNAQQNAKLGELRQKANVVVAELELELARNEVSFDISSDDDAPNSTPRINELRQQVSDIGAEAEVLHTKAHLTSVLWSMEVDGFRTDAVRKDKLDLLVCKGWQVVAYKKPRPTISDMLRSVGIEVIPLPRG